MSKGERSSSRATEEAARTVNTLWGTYEGFVKRRPVSPEFAHALRQADPQRGAALAEGLQGALPAIALTGHTALSTAFLNDVDGEMIYAQQLYGYGKKGDVFMGISTSGNAENVMYAVAVASVRH